MPSHPPPHRGRSQGALQAHLRSGAGTHGDRRLKRLGTRSAQQRATLKDEE